MIAILKNPSPAVKINLIYATPWTTLTFFDTDNQIILWSTGYVKLCSIFKLNTLIIDGISLLFLN